MAITGIKSYPEGVLVTGLTASGTTDGVGTWNSNVNIETILNTASLSLPDNAVAVVIRMTNLSSSSSRWGGVRTNGATTALVQRSMIAGNEDNFIPLRLNPANNSLADFYAQAVTGSDRVEFRIHQAWVGATLLDIDQVGGLPTQTTTANALVTRTISEVPANSTVIVKTDSGSFKWCPTSSSTVQTNGLTGFHMIKVDGSQQVKLQMSVTLRIFGYWLDGDVEWEPWLSAPLTPTFDSAWHDSSFIKSGKIAVYGYHDDATTTSRHDARAKGSTRAVIPATGMSGIYNSFMSTLDSNGESQYWVETAGVGNLYYHATFNEFTGAATSLIVPDPIQPNTTVTLTPENFDGALTSATLTDALGNVITRSVTSNDITIPAIAETSDTIQFGIITVAATDGVGTASDTTNYTPSTGYAVTTVSSPVDDGYSLYSLLFDEGKTVVNGDQFYYPTAYSTTIAPSTIVTTNAENFVCYLIETTGECWEINYFSTPEPSLTLRRSGISLGFGIGFGI